MPTLRDLQNALANAQKAGDAEAVTALSGELARFSNPEAFIKPDRTLTETLTSGISRGASNLGITLGDDLPALAGSMVGAKDYAKRQMEEAAASRAELERTNPAQYKAFKEDVKGPRDFLGYAVETIGEQVAPMATTIVPGMGAGALGARVGAGLGAKAAARMTPALLESGATAAEIAGASAVKGAAAKALGTKVGQGVGVYLGSYAQAAPEVFTNIYEETGKIEPGAAALAGAVSAALDSILPAQILNRMSGPARAGLVEKLLAKSGMQPGLARGAAAAVITGIPTEALTEGTQEGISIAAERFVAENPQLFGSKEWDRIIESSIRGAVGGGAFGAVSGAVGGARERGALNREEEAEQAALAEQEALAQEQQRAAEAQAAENPTSAQLAEFDAIQSVKERDSVMQGLEGVAPVEAPVQVETRKPGLEEADPAALGMQYAQPGETLDMFAGMQGTPTPQPVQDAAPEPKARRASAEITPESLAAVGLKPQSGFYKALVGKNMADPEQAQQVAEILATVRENNRLAKSTKEGIEGVAMQAFNALADQSPLDLGDRLSAENLLDYVGIPKSAPVYKDMRDADLSDPTQMKAFRAALDDFAKKTKKKGMPERIEQFLSLRTDNAPAETFSSTAPKPYDDPYTDEGQIDPLLEALVTKVESTPETETNAWGPVDTPAVEAVQEPVPAKPKGKRGRPTLPENVMSDVDPAAAWEDMADLENPNTPKYDQLPADLKGLWKDYVAAGAASMDAANQVAETHRKNAIAEKQNKRVRQVHKLADDDYSEGSGRTGNTKESVIAALNKLFQTPAAAERVTVFDTQDEAKAAGALPQDYNGFAKGWVTPEGQVYLVAENIPQGREVGTFLHELGVHVGMEGFLSPEDMKWLSAKVEAWAAADDGSLESNVAKEAVQRAAASSSANKRKELVAYMVEGLVNAGLSPQGAQPKGTGKGAVNWFQRVWNAFRKALDRLRIRSADLSGQDLVDLSYGAAQLALRGEMPPSRTSTAYSDSDTSRISKMSDYGFAHEIADITGDRSNLQELISNRQRIPDNTRAAMIREGVKQRNAKAPAGVQGELFSDVSRNQFSEEMNVPGGISRALPQLTENLKDSALNTMSKVPDGLRRGALGMMSLPQINELYGDELPSIKRLETALTARAKERQDSQEKIGKNVVRWVEVAKKHKKSMGKFFDIANQTTLDQIDVLDEKQANHPLTKQFKQLPAELQEIYSGIRKAYDKFSEDFIELMKTKADPTVAEKVRNQFEKGRLKVYLPLRRYGEYWMTYTDKTGEPVVQAFESPRERDAAATQAAKSGAKDVQFHAKLAQISHRQAPPTGLIAEILTSLKGKGATNEMLDSVYQMYLDRFPSDALRQQFRARKDGGVKGFDPDIIKAYADVATKMANQMSNMKHLPEIDSAMAGIKGEAGSNPTMEIRDVVDNLAKQEGFLRNPVNASWVNSASYASYMWYIAGNISSALVNLTQMPMVVYPLLGGKYGPKKAYAAMQDATRMYWRGGKDNNSAFMPDHTFGTKATGEYKKLYEAALNSLTIRRSTGHEIAEARRRGVEDYTGLRARVEHGLGWIFQNSERANREITLIATFKLAREAGKDVDTAIAEAIKTTNDSHGVSSAELGPRFFQQGIGKVAFTFKRFAQQQIYLMSRLFHQAFKGADKETRELARRQLVGVYGMTFAFAGVQGLPLFGAANMMASFLLGDEDEPFDLDEYVKRAMGDLGYKGPVNQILNLDIASRTGFNGMIWRDDPRRLAEVGYTMYILERLGGPAVSIGTSMERGAKHLAEGNYDRAMEAFTPSFLRNSFKTLRFGMNGATTKDGIPIVEDVNAYNVFMQAFGFTPADLSEASARAGAMKRRELHIDHRRKSLLDRFYAARVSGDIDGMDEIRERIAQFNESIPEKAITGKTLESSYKGHRAREAAMVDGVSLDPKLKARLMEMVGSEE